MDSEAERATQQWQSEEHNYQKRPGFTTNHLYDISRNNNYSRRHHITRNPPWDDQKYPENDPGRHHAGNP